MITANTNISALRTQGALERNVRDLNLLQERLSSGSRINRASDDASGLSVAAALNVDAKILGVAVRNINDGISMLHIGGDALSSQGQIQSRLEELAEQSANGTLSDKQRVALSKEYSALVAEYGRIGDTTSFNGISILRRGRALNEEDTSIQAGIDSTSGSQIPLPNVDTADLNGTLDFDGLSNFTAIFGNEFTFDEFAAAFNNQIWRTTATDTAGATRTVWLGLAGAAGIGISQEVGIVAFTVPQALEGTSPTDAPDYIGDALAFSLFQSTRATFDPTTGRLNQSGNPVAVVQDGAVNISIPISFAGIRMRSDIGNAPALQPGPVLEFTGVETATRARAALDALKLKRNTNSSAIGAFGALSALTFPLQRFGMPYRSG